MNNCGSPENPNCGEPCYTNPTCGGVVSSFTFPTTTTTPPTLPENIPATNVAFNFKERLCAIASNANNNCDVLSSVDDALNLINEYFCSFPPTLDDSLNDSILIYNVEDRVWVKQKLIDSVLKVLGNFLNPGETIIGTPGGSAPLQFCEQVYECLLRLFCRENQVITLQNGRITTVSIDDIVEGFVEDLFGADGDILIRQRGEIESVNFEGLVTETLTLPPNNFWFGGATGGFFPTNFTTQVSNSLSSLVDEPGDFFIAGCDGNISVTNFCQETIKCLEPLLGENEIFFGEGLTPTPFCGAIIQSNCLAPGTFFFNSGCGTAIVEFCPEVINCVGEALGENEIFLGTADGVAAINLCDAFFDTADCFGGLLGDNEIIIGTPDSYEVLNICDALRTSDCFVGEAGDIYINDGTNYPVSYNFLEYFNEFLIPPLPVCEGQVVGLVYDPGTGTWDFGDIIRNRPTLAEITNYSPPTLRTNKAKMYLEWGDEGQCTEWKCSPRQREYSILVPGDFPDLASAVDWLQAKTIDNIAIDVQAPQPAQVFEGFNGRLFVNFNGNTSGGIAVTSPTADVELSNAIVTGGVTATNGATLRVQNVTAEGHFGDGFAANRHSRIIFLTDTISRNNGLSGFRCRNGSYLHFLGGGENISEGNTSGFIIDGDSGAKAVNGGKFTARNNAVNGFVVTEAGSLITDEGDILSEDNGRSGFEIANNGYLKGVNIESLRNVESGLRARSGSNVTIVDTLTITDSQERGLVIEEGGNIQSDGNVIISNSGAQNIVIDSGNLDARENLATLSSGAQGILLTNHGSLTVDNFLTVLDATTNGVVVNIGSTLSVGSGATILNSGRNGLLVGVGATAILNTQFDISNNANNGVQVFDQSTLVGFNGSITGNGGAYGIEAVNNSSASLYSTNITGNTLDVFARELSVIRVVQPPFLGTIGTQNPVTLSTQGNLGAFII